MIFRWSSGVRRRGVGGAPAPHQEGLRGPWTGTHPRLRMANALSAIDATANPLISQRSLARLVPDRSVSVALTPSAAYVGGASFAVQGLNLGRDWAIVGGGVRYELASGWNLYGNYDAQVNTQQVFHVGSGGAQYAW